MSEYIDIYCERIAPGLFAEPLNAISNLSFFVAAFFAYRLAHKYSVLDWRSGILIFLLCLIGTGSSLFHSFATKATMVMDVVPILLYQMAFIGIYTRRIMALSWAKTLMLFVLFLISSALADRIPSSVMNGSLSYAPAFVFLLGFGIWHHMHKEREGWVLIIAAAFFALSLTFRSIDMALCPHISIGTHYLWHMLNGIVLYLTARSYIKAIKPMF